MAIPFCTFSYQPNNTFVRMYYRTSTFGVEGFSSSIFYRKNEGPWIQIPDIISHQGPTYLQVLDIQAKTNDKIDYFFANTTGTLSYGVGQNGPYFGQTGIVTSIMIFGPNYIYLNICSEADNIGIIGFCPNNLYSYCATRCLYSQQPDPVYTGNCWSNTIQPKFSHPSPSLSVGDTVTGTDGYCYKVTSLISPSNVPSIAGPIVTLSSNTIIQCWECQTLSIGCITNLPVNTVCTTVSTDYVYYKLNNGPWIPIQVSPTMNGGATLADVEVAVGTVVSYYFSQNNNRPWGIGFNSGDFSSQCGTILTTTVTGYTSVSFNLPAYFDGVNCQFSPPVC